MDQIKPEATAERDPAKRSYVPPRIEDLGSIEDVTAGGGRPNPDGSGGAISTSGA